MKKTNTKRVITAGLTLLLAILFVLGAVSCSAGMDYASGMFGGGGYRVDKGEIADGAYEEAPAGADGGDSGENEETKPTAGLMTAKAWNDNEHFEDWAALFEQGKKFEYYTQNDWKLPTLKRLTVRVTCGGEPVGGAYVACDGEDGTGGFRAVTDKSGIAYVYTTAARGRIRVASGNGGVYEGSTGFDADQSREVSVEIDGKEDTGYLLQIKFVVDVTGSMGDEIDFLKTELADVIDRVRTGNPDASIELSFIFYRDDGDDQKFSTVSFTNVTDPLNYKKIQNALDKQSADGGGDYPEALDEALAMAVDDQWAENATKLMFVVLDAPAHSGEQYQKRFSDAVKTAAEMGIRICPVLASGADNVCEYICRTAALYTGGTSVFITDESGIGGQHRDPDLPDAVVERLNLLLVRLINGYYTGTFSDPVPWFGQQ